MGTSVSMSRPRAKELIKTAQANRILVLGDVILDQFIWGRVRRISPEAPVPIVEFERESYIPGGAANVARNLAALGVPVSMVGVVGRDTAGKQVKQLLQQSGVEVKGLLEGRDRVTSIKSRIVGATSASLPRGRSRKYPGPITNKPTGLVV